MTIYSYREINSAPRGGVIALGFFDGVHSAHRSLILEAKKRAEAIGAPLGIFTFSAESGIKKDTQRLYTTEERLGIIEGLSVDFAVVAEFSEICALCPEEFVGEVLISGLDAAVAFAGYNFRFGKGALGHARDLERLMTEAGRDAVICNEITRDGKRVSSTAVRSLIESGEMKEAAELLGSPYFLTGKVVKGNGQGRSLGFPTVNTPLRAGKVIPKLGVYRSLVKLPQGIYNGVTNLGVCPTLGERDAHAETYIIDFDGDVYGENVTVYLLEYLREERTFAGKEELIMQINIDKNTTIEKNGEEKWQELGLR